MRSLLSLGRARGAASRTVDGRGTGAAGAAGLPARGRSWGLRGAIALAGTLGALLVCSAPALAGAPETQETCSNEQLRAEQPFGPRLPDCRAYEMVTPLDKNDSDAVVKEREAARASVSGDAITYESAGVFAGPEGNELSNQYISRREANGWSTLDITPPYTSTVLNVSNPYQNMVFTPELTEGVPLANVALTGESVAEHKNLYVADFSTVPTSYQLITLNPELEASETGSPYPNVVGEATNLSHVIYEELSTRPGEKNEIYLYEWVNGKQSLVNIGPEGERLPYVGAGAGEVTLGNAAFSWRSVSVSAGGSRVFFTSPSSTNEKTYRQLYVREHSGQPQSPLAPGASGMGELTGKSNVVSNVVTSTGAFQVGQYISGEAVSGEEHYIPYGTFITAVAPGTITLSQKAKTSVGKIALTSVGGCTVSTDACTLDVSRSQRTPEDPAGVGNARFQGASVNGARVFFTDCAKLTDDATANAPATEEGAGQCLADPGTGKDLYEYDLETGALTDLTVDELTVAKTGDPLGAQVLGVPYISESGEYVYFVAEGKLTTGENAEGREPVSGEPNLYVTHLREGSWTTKYIATLAAPTKYEGQYASAEGPDANDWSAISPLDSVRATPDGARLAFLSTEPLTGYDNEQAEPEECEKGAERGRYQEDGECREVFSYDALSEKLVCASCDPSGARPIGPSQLGEVQTFVSTLIGHTPLNFSEDGARLFFETGDALVPYDSNGLRDVYELEQPASPAEMQAGENSCTQASPDFSESAEGCLFPVSDVAGNYESVFLDASPDGSNAFFATEDQLVPGDIDDHVNVFDARVGGGFPVSSPPPACDNGDSCKGPASPQPSVFGAPASSTFSGAGNVTPVVAVMPAVKAKARAKPKCRKGFVKRRGRCVKRPRVGKKAKRSSGHSNKGGK
jgi:hypothetical protein